MSLQAYLQRTWRRLPFTNKEPLDDRVDDTLDDFNEVIDVIKAELKHIKQKYEAIDDEGLPKVNQKRKQLAYEKFSARKRKVEEVILYLVALSYLKTLRFDFGLTYQNNTISMSSPMCENEDVHNEIIEKVRAELDVSRLRDILTLTLPGESAVLENQCSDPWESELCSAVCSSLQPELPTQEMTRLLIDILGEEVSSHLYYNRLCLETAPDTNADFSDIAEYETSD